MGPLLRSAFIALSRNRALRSFSEQSSLGRRLSGRFVAGMSIDDALSVCAAVNGDGMAVSVDSLGESVTSEAQACASAEAYHQLLDAIRARGLNANVSVKLTQMGMDFDPVFAESVMTEIVAHAAVIGNFVRVDMEGSNLTEPTIAMVERLHAQSPGHVGTVLQAYLYRTEADAERLLQQGIRIRLCKGAYKEGPEVAFPEKAAVDANYLKLARRMVGSPVFCGMATHDETIINEICRYVQQQGIERSSFEFQMLYGVRRDLQRRLVREGYGVRVYIPFGPEWYPYFMRRLAERPANVLFLLRNLFKS